MDMAMMRRRQTLFDVYEVLVSGGYYGADEATTERTCKGSYPIRDLAQQEVDRLYEIERKSWRAKQGVSAMYIVSPKTIFVNPNQVWQPKPEYFVHLDEVDPIPDTCGEIRELLSTETMSHAYVKLRGIAKEHKHEVMDEVYTIIKGAGYLTIAGNKYEVDVGETIAIPKHEWHYLESEGGLELLVVTSPRFDPKDVILK